MTAVEPRPHSVPALPPDLRRSAIGRRVSASGSLAIVLADLAFGTPRRSDLAALVSVTSDRVSAYAGARG